MYNLYHKGYKRLCADLEDKGILRTLQAVSYKSDAINFATNDYLALAGSNYLVDTAIEAAKRYGVGATGSRLLSGNLPVFTELEEQIAASKGTEAAIVFNSGFQANISTLSCLLNPTALGRRSIVLFDRLNHSSLYQAVFLSGAEMVRYRHSDTAHLRSIFQQLDPMRPKFLVTETVFGMDGDFLPQEIIELAKQYCAFIYLDEAHATGVLGPTGYGLSALYRLENHPHVVMGTFSKALGGSGAYIACNNTIKQYIINKATGFIYSTANSPIVAAAALAAWKMVPKLCKERKELANLAQYCRKCIKEQGFDVGNSESHIIPIIIGEGNKVLKMKQYLLEKHNIITCAILPPTVPYGAARLRIALNVDSTKVEVDRLVAALRALRE